MIFFLLPFFIVGFRLSPSVALFLGIIVGVLSFNPFPRQTKFLTKILLQSAIVGLGFGMNFEKVMEAGKDGFFFTLLTIVAAMGVGYVLGRLLHVKQKISYLISAGTVICGGSAIAAVSQVLDADENDISVSIGIVFILNAVALFIFPSIGHFFDLTQQQFGIWSAIAIHDTSSVVGASSQYGDEALMVATTVKLTRTLWIIPLVLATALFFRKKARSAFPWFILFFVVASLVRSYSSFPPILAQQVVEVAKVIFGLTLYLIGTSISVQAIRNVGARPFLQGTLLWIFVIVLSLTVITFVPGR